jgi:thiol-disulfide isomerase/thioredoxin
MKIMKVIHIVLLIVLMSYSKTTLFSQTPAGGNFDINSQTLILDGEGNYIDFKTFIGLNSGSDYSELVPEFDKNGNLVLIKIKLKKPLVVKKKKSEPTVVSSPPQKEMKKENKHTSIPKVEKKIKQKTFRFTTASELEGLQAPYYNEKNLSGKEFSTNSLHGKIVIIKFWFLRCAPCLEEIPELNRLAEKYKKNSDVVFIAPATDDFSAVRKFLSKRSFKYTILPDSYDIHGDFKVAGYPTHMVIYKNGEVGKVLTGKNTQLVNVLSTAIDEGLLMEADDISVKEIQQPFYTPSLVIIAEEGHRLSKEEYFEKLVSNEYKIYRKIKIDGREEIFLKHIE